MSRGSTEYFDFGFEFLNKSCTSWSELGKLVIKFIVKFRFLHHRIFKRNTLALKNHNRIDDTQVHIAII